MKRTYFVIVVSLLVAVAVAQAQEPGPAGAQTQHPQHPQYAPEHAIIESGAAGHGNSFDPAPDSAIDRIVPRDLDPVH